MENILYYVLVFIGTIIIPIFAAWLYLVPSQLALKKKLPNIGMLMTLNIFVPISMLNVNPQFSAMFWVVVFIWAVAARGQKATS